MNEVNQPVTSAPASQTPDQMHSSSEESHNSKVIPIIIAIVALVLVGIGSYILGTKKSQPVVENIAQTTPIPSPIPTIDETANWKTFSSTTFGISYKYPSEWNNDNVCQSCSAQPIIESSSERYLHPVNIKYPLGITYSADAKTNSAPLSFFINSLKTRNLTNKTTKELSINGSNGFEVTGSDENGKKIALAVFENKDYIFQFTSSENYIDTLETLLSTFQFTP